MFLNIRKGCTMTALFPWPRARLNRSLCPFVYFSMGHASEQTTNKNGVASKRYYHVGSDRSPEESGKQMQSRKKQPSTEYRVPYLSRYCLLSRWGSISVWTAITFTRVNTHHSVRIQRIFTHQKNCNPHVHADSRATRRRGGFFRSAADAGVGEEIHKIQGLNIV